MKVWRRSTKSSVLFLICSDFKVQKSALFSFISFVIPFPGRSRRVAFSHSSHLWGRRPGPGTHGREKMENLRFYFGFVNWYIRLWRSQCLNRHDCHWHRHTQTAAAAAAGAASGSRASAQLSFDKLDLVVIDAESTAEVGTAGGEREQHHGMMGGGKQVIKTKKNLIILTSPSFISESDLYIYFLPTSGRCCSLWIRTQSGMSGTDN